MSRARCPMTLRSLLLANVFLGWLAGAPGGAQEARPRSGIDGIVTDTSLRPLQGATVTILGSSLQVVTGANGRFRITSLAPDSYVLVVRKVGYSPASELAHVPADEPLRVTISLPPSTFSLDTVRVAAVRTSMRLAEFEERRKRGDGQFITAAEIEKHNFLTTADLFRPLLGVAVIGDKHVVNRRMPARATGACVMQIFLDGVALPVPTSIDEALPAPQELAGVEVYVSPGTIPLQYRTIGGGGFCGVILFWTKDGS